MIADIILLAFILLFVMMGRRKGFIRSVMGFCTFFVSFILAGIIKDPVTNMMKTTEMYKNTETAVSNGIAKKIAEGTSGLPDFLVSGLRGAAVDTVTDTVMRLFVSLLIFAIAVIILRIAIKLLDGVFSLPVLKSFNKLGGAILGAASAFVIVYAVFGIWGFGSGFAVPGVLESSTLAKSMFINNIILIPLGL